MAASIKIFEQARKVPALFMVSSREEFVQIPVYRAGCTRRQFRDCLSVGIRYSAPPPGSSPGL